MSALSQRAAGEDSEVRLVINHQNVQTTGPKLSGSIHFRDYEAAHSAVAWHNGFLAAFPSASDFDFRTDLLRDRSGSLLDVGEEAVVVGRIVMGEEQFSDTGGSGHLYDVIVCAVPPI